MVERPSMLKRPSSNDKGVSPPPSKRKQQSTTTSKAVASFFTPLSKKEPDKMTWRIVKDSLLVGRYAASPVTPLAAQSKRRIAAFDFDSTLVTPLSGNRFGRDATDWKWWHTSVPSTLKSLHENGHLIAILSNQGGISLAPSTKTLKSDQKRLADFKQKLSAVCTQLDIPISVYAATGRDIFRKPRAGMWKEVLDDYDLDSADAVDLAGSFFVGDAGGREAVAGGGAEGKGVGVGKDHSCVDRDFAANIPIPFHTPEEYFLHETPRPFTRDFDPRAYLQQASHAAPSLTFTKPYTPDIVLFCGSPGAGKSSFYWRHFQPLGYARVNQDILKTREKCVKAATALVQEGSNVVVDNTNVDPDTRAVWIKLAQNLGVSIRCILFTAPAKLCEHNDTVRALSSGPDSNPENRTLLPKLAFTGFASRYREPTISEGFADIIKVDFEFEGSDAQKEIWSRYWI